MTDGISCSWSRSTETSTVKRKKGTVSIIVPLSTLGHVDPQARPKELGRNGESVWIDRGPLNIVVLYSRFDIITTVSLLLWRQAQRPQARIKTQPPSQACGKRISP